MNILTQYRKSDMVYCNYDWTAYSKDDPKISGELDSTLFNRNEGHEILYIINKIFETFEFINKDSCNKMERLIQEHLPLSMNRQEDVRTWISNNW